MKNRLRRIFPLALLLLSAVARASPLGFSLELWSNSEYEAIFRLSNNSPTASIDAFRFTIGDPAYNFDAVRTDDDGNGSYSGIDASRTGQNQATGIGYSIAGPDGDALGGMRSDQLDFRFANFSYARSLLFAVDIDQDGDNTRSAFGTVFFNNGTALRSQATIGFSTGDILGLTLPETPPEIKLAARRSGYRFSVEDLRQPVPEPPAPALLALGIAALLACRYTGRPARARLRLATRRLPLRSDADDAAG